MGRKLEQFDPFFFEEPILYDNVDALAEVARAINIPVAAGERLYTRWEFRSLLERHCVRIIQPDICHAGGIMELKKIATMAETYYVAVQPHNANGPISTLASMHLDATIPNFIIQEFFHPYLERYNQILTEPIQYEGRVPAAVGPPGLGGRHRRGGGGKTAAGRKAVEFGERALAIRFGIGEQNGVAHRADRSIFPGSRTATRPFSSRGATICGGRA